MRKIQYTFPAFIVFYEFSLYLSNDMFLPAVSTIASDFSVSQNMVQWTITLWLLGIALPQVIFGSLSDQIGRRPVIFGGGILFLLVTFGCAVLNNFGFFLFFRFLQGVACCSLMTAGYAAVHEYYTDDNKAIKVIAWMVAITMIAPAAGPIMGAYLLKEAHWRIIFYLIGFVSFFFLACLWFVMPETNSTPSRDSLKTQVLVYKKLLLNKGYLLSCFTYVFSAACFSIWIVASPFLIMNVLDYSPEIFGYSQVPIIVAFILGSQIAKWRVGKTPKNRLIKWGIFFSSSGGILLSICSYVWPQNLYGLLAPMTFYMIGLGMMGPPLVRIAIKQANEKMGATNALFYTFLMGFGTVGGAMVSFFYNQTLFSVSLIISVFVIISFLLNLKRVNAAF